MLKYAASEGRNLGVNTEIGGSPYRLQHDHSLVGITDPGVDLLVTVVGSCQFGAQIGEIVNIFKVFFINHDWVFRSSNLPPKLGHLCVDFETKHAGWFAKTFSFLFGILMFTG